mmetsp:Transcript_31475/g.51366  ORF Transcript_31475/g.51366 Transcript_31475/m.51366 type:complete len:174 (-) Transcript_31475:181-702(-)
MRDICFCIDLSDCFIVLEIELLGGHFLVRQGTDLFTLATDKLKKIAVQRRLQRKDKGSKKILSALALPFLSAFLGGPPLLGKASEVNELFLLSSCGRSSVLKAIDEDKLVSLSLQGVPPVGGKSLDKGKSISLVSLGGSPLGKATAGRREHFRCRPTNFFVVVGGTSFKEGFR